MSMGRNTVGKQRDDYVAVMALLVWVFPCLIVPRWGS